MQLKISLSIMGSDADGYTVLDTLDLFDRSTIRVLVDLLLPLEEVEEQEGEGDEMHSRKNIVSRGQSDVLMKFLSRKWNSCHFVQSYIVSRDEVSIEDINRNSAMFRLLVESFIKQCALERVLHDLDGLSEESQQV